MKIKTLIKRLSEYDGNREVVLSCDSEGNIFRELSPAFGSGAFDGETFGLERLTPDLEESGFTEEDVVRGKKVVALYPE